VGSEVPHDQSVVGYDNLPIVQWVAPPLTSVGQDLAAQGAVITRLLLDLVQGRTPATPDVNLACDLVVRGSRAPPRQ
jgi:LacI family transcriptional regulator